MSAAQGPTSGTKPSAETSSGRIDINRDFVAEMLLKLGQPRTLAERERPLSLAEQIAQTATSTKTKTAIGAVRKALPPPRTYEVKPLSQAEWWSRFWVGCGFAFGVARLWLAGRRSPASAG